MDAAGEDDRAMARIASGQLDALGEIVGRHGAPLARFLARMTGDAAAADDLAQETFVRVLVHARRYRIGEGFRAWMYAIARNLALRHLRRRRRESNGSLAPAAVEPEKSAERRELEAAIDRAIDAVEEPYRSALLLCAVQGLSYEEAAQACGCSVKTLSSRLARGRERFREMIAPYLSEGTLVRPEERP